jgi:hypothetical protein
MAGLISVAVIVTEAGNVRASARVTTPVPAAISSRSPDVIVRTCSAIRRANCSKSIGTR